MLCESEYGVQPVTLKPLSVLVIFGEKMVSFASFVAFAHNKINYYAIVC